MYRTELDKIADELPVMINSGTQKGILLLSKHKCRGLDTGLISRTRRFVSPSSNWCNFEIGSRNFDNNTGGESKTLFLGYEIYLASRSTQVLPCYLMAFDSSFDTIRISIPSKTTMDIRLAWGYTHKFSAKDGKLIPLIPNGTATTVTRQSDEHPIREAVDTVRRMDEDVFGRTTIRYEDAFQTTPTPPPVAQPAPPTIEGLQREVDRFIADHPPEQINIDMQPVYIYSETPEFPVERTREILLLRNAIITNNFEAAAYVVMTAEDRAHGDYGTYLPHVLSFNDLTNY